MATTSNSYTGNNSTVDFAFTFPYLKSTDIKVSLDEVVKTLTTHYTLHNATTIRFGTAPGTGVKVKIYRDTASAELAATFYPGSAIRSSDLNDNYTQNLYVTQEAENDATTALDNSRVLESGSYVSAITKATSAVTTANTASTNATNAVNTANTASTNASNAVSTANSASSTAGTASTNATNAVNTANTANSTANTANSTADDAETKADSAVATANTASTNATNAVSTANTASTNATNAVSTANTASTNASNAVTTANAASAAVADAVLYTPKANKAALESTEPSEDGYYEVQDSTSLANGTWTYNSITYTLSGFPGTLTGNSGLTVRLSYTHSSKTYAYSSYFANDPEDRYIAKPSPTLGGNLDVKANEITTTTTNGNIKLTPNGTGVLEVKGNTNPGTIQLNCENNSHSVKIKGPAHSAAASYTLTLPNDDGSANQVLSTNGSGVLSWADSSAGATGAGTDEVFVENSQTVTGSYSLSSNKNAHLVGPISLNSGVVVTVPANATLLIH